MLSNSGSSPLNAIYKKISGLEQLEEMRFPVPAYQVIDITEDKPHELRKYLLDKVWKLQIPHDAGNVVGVTIRVSMPGFLDKLTTHGGLHVTDMNDILAGIVAKYRQYGPSSKIVVQHTVDARCSGAVLKEDNCCVVETIPGDAPPLLEGHSTDFERWGFQLTTGEWKKERIYKMGDKKESVLSQGDLKKLEKYLRMLPCNAYVEWSISKRDKLLFYEYCKLNN